MPVASLVPDALSDWAPKEGEVRHLFFTLFYPSYHPSSRTGVGEVLSAVLTLALLTAPTYLLSQVMADAFIKEMEAFDGEMEKKCAAAEKACTRQPKPQP